MRPRPGRSRWLAGQVFNLLALLAALLLCQAGLAERARAAEAPLLGDAEEYAVLAALLFPDRPAGGAELPARLPGIGGSSYRLCRFTLAGPKAEQEGEAAMVADYNRRNQQIHQLDEDRLQPLVPRGGHLTLVDGHGAGGSDDGMAGGATTSVSRPGYNAARNRALVQINHVAGPEVGVGYQVYLEKGAAGWRISRIELNRMY